MILTGEAVKTTDRAQELLTHAASVVLEGLGEKDETVAEEIGARALRCLLKHFDLVDRDAQGWSYEPDHDKAHDRMQDDRMEREAEETWH